MKFLIASDIHGSAKYLEMVCKRIKEENPDKVLLLGDLLYHGPRNDLPDGYNPKKCIELLNDLADKVLCVRGNCDAEVDQMVLSFPIMVDYIMLELDGISIYATHGHVYNADKPFSGAKKYILLHGHTHIPVITDYDDFTYINPGSVSIPKDNSFHSYMIYENKIFNWKDLESGTVYNSLDLN